MEHGRGLAAQWEHEHFTLQSVDAYEDMVRERERCVWSPKVSVANHTLKHMRAKYPFEKSEAALRQHGRRFIAGCGMDWSAMVQVCVLPETDGGGPAGQLVRHQWFFTRVGPLPVGPGAFKCIALIPAMPASPQSTFLIESSDTYFADARDGRGYREVGYPPLHPHHANSFMVGYNDELTQMGQDSVFKHFYPWPAYSTAQWTQFGAQASMNSPGFNADFVGCRPNTKLGACFHLQTPPGTGFPVYRNTDMWSSSLLNRVGNWMERDPNKEPMMVMWHFGRKFASSTAGGGGTGVKPAAFLTPLWSLDFAVVGNGNTYEIGGFAKLEGIVFHTYTMPVAGTVRGSWFHTHAQAKSEMWVLGASYEAMLPPAIVDACEKRGICKPTGPSAQGTTGRVAFPLLDEFGFDIARLQAYVRTRAAPERALRCEYRSAAVPDASGTMWGRQSLRRRSSRETCDDWVFEAGQHITLLAFDFARDSGVVQQHQRWFATLELVIPKPASFRPPVISGAPVPMLAALANNSNNSNDWMEYMG